MGAAWLDTTTVYGPAFTLASEPVAARRGRSSDASPPGCSRRSPPLPRSRRRSSPAGSRAVARSRSAFVGWNPLLAIHLAGGGHNDAWVGALVAGRARARRRPAASRARARCGRSRSPSSGCRSSFSRSARSRRARAAAPRGTAGFAVAAAAIVAASRRGATGSHWPLAIFPLAGNAALETSYAIPHRLEQLGVPHGARARARRRRRSSPGSPGSRAKRAAAGRASASRRASSSRRRPTSRSGTWPGPCRSPRPTRTTWRQVALPRALRLPAAPDDPALAR